MRISHSCVVGKYIEQPAKYSCKDHGDSPEDYAVHITGRNNIINHVLKYIWQNKLKECAK